MQAVTHLGRQLGDLRAHRRPNDPSASASNPDPDPCPRTEIPVDRTATFDLFRQFPPAVRDVSFQSDSVATRDVGAGADLLRLETTLAMFRPFLVLSPSVASDKLGCCGRKWGDSRSSKRGGWPARN